MAKKMGMNVSGTVRNDARNLPEERNAVRVEVRISKFVIRVTYSHLWFLPCLSVSLSLSVTVAVAPSLSFCRFVYVAPVALSLCLPQFLSHYICVGASPVSVSGCECAFV